MNEETKSIMTNWLNNKICQKVEKNLEKWGLQTMNELLLATMEELGELTRAYLRQRYEHGDQKEIDDELDDLAALIFQMKLRRCI